MAKPRREVVPASEVVLVGAGHSHIEVIHRYRKLSPKPYRLTLVNANTELAYAGMLPGMIAGIYRTDEGQIDLGHLCSQAGVRFVYADVVGIDPKSRLLHLANPARTLNYDALSIDIGIFANAALPGGLQNPIMTIKPVEKFMQWLSELERISEGSPQKLVVQGDDYSAIEIVLALAHRFQLCPRSQLSITYCSPQERLLDGLHKSFDKPLQQRLASNRIELKLGAAIAKGDGKKELTTKDGKKIAADFFLNLAAPTGASWLASSGIRCSSDGQLEVNDNLESTSHEGIYAAGDVAQLKKLPKGRSLSGYLGKRLGRVLSDNFRRRFLGIPQMALTQPTAKKYFISADGKRAYGSWYGLSFSPRRMWLLKDETDRAWMRRYQVEPVTGRYATFMESGNLTEDPCTGTATRIALATQECQTNNPALAAALTSSGVSDIELASGKHLFQTLDFLRCFCSDLFMFGAIAMNHFVMHVLASGKRIDSVQVFVGTEFGPKQAMTRDLTAMLAGAQATVDRYKMGKIVSGYYWGSWESVMGATTQSLTTDLGPSKAPKPGDRIILTRPIGSGVLLTGHRRYQVQSNAVQHALHKMAEPHPHLDLVAPAAKFSTLVGAFGLADALSQSLSEHPALSVTVHTHKLPVFSGALKALAAGLRSSLHTQNRLRYSRSLQGLAHKDIVLAEMLFDPQTAGAIAVCVEEKDVKATLQAMHSSGLLDAAEIAEIGEIEPDRPQLLIHSA